MAADLWDTRQVYPNAGTLTPLYACPNGRRATESTILVCNQSDQDTTFRVSLALSAAPDASKQYWYYDTSLRANRTFAATLGKIIPAGGVLRVWSGNGRCSFSVSFVEKDA